MLKYGITVSLHGYIYEALKGLEQLNMGECKSVRIQ